jgi:hypothetical protein
MVCRQVMGVTICRFQGDGRHKSLLFGGRFSLRRRRQAARRTAIAPGGYGKTQGDLMMLEPDAPAAGGYEGLINAAADA